MRWLVTCVLIQLPFILNAKDLFPYINYAVEPCDDFYKFACGNFETVHPVPPSYKTWNEFTRLQKKIDEQLKELLEGSKSKSDTRSFTKARTMYASCMDTNVRNEKGVSPIRKILEGWPTRYNTENSRTKITSTDWNRMANFVAKYGVQFIFKLKVRADMFNATRTSIYIESDDLELPTSLLKESGRILDNDFSSRTDSTLTRYLTKVMTTLRDSNGSNIDDEEILTVAKSINEFMLGLDDAMTLNYEDIATTNIIPSTGSITLGQLNAWSNEVLANFADPINWESYLQKAFKKSGVRVDKNTQIFITNRNLLRNLLIYAHKTERKLLDDFIYSRLATYMTPELSSDLYNIALNFYTIRGYIPSDYPRWKYCLHKVLDFPKIGLSLAVVQKYREIYISEERIEKAQEMVENLRKALQELIDEAYWMDNATRNYAVYKLQNILILTGSRDSLKTRREIDKYYKKLRISRNDHFGNMNRLRSFSQGKNFAELGYPRNRNLWTQSPLSVNAYYNGINNRILFPITTMIEPFFTGNTASFSDYARIGSIMAHELTHAFDSQGKLLDAEGSMVSWWSESTGRMYANKTKCFVNQYNQYVIEGSYFTVDGKYTLPENIADNVGLRAAFRAFKNKNNRTFSRSFSSGRDYFTTDQEFYLAFASTWCDVSKTLYSDKHAPHRYRVLGPIQNMKNFFETWQCEASVNDNKDVCILW